MRTKYGKYITNLILRYHIFNEESNDYSYDCLGIVLTRQSPKFDFQTIGGLSLFPQNLIVPPLSHPLKLTIIFSKSFFRVYFLLACHCHCWGFPLVQKKGSWTIFPDCRKRENDFRTIGGLSLFPHFPRKLATTVWRPQVKP